VKRDTLFSGGNAGKVGPIYFRPRRQALGRASALPSGAWRFGVDGDKKKGGGIFFLRGCIAGRAVLFLGNTGDIESPGILFRGGRGGGRARF